MKARSLLVLLVVAPLVLSGCASTLDSQTYSRADALSAQRVQYGYIEAIKPVRLEGTKTPIGTLAGAGVGGVAGSAIGQGRGSVIGAIAGAVIGGVAGAAAEEGLTRRQGVQLTIRLEGRHRDWYEGQYRHRYAEGRTIAVVQQVSPDVHYRIGDRVQVLTSRNGQTRVDVVN